jgi:hypothetical protein
MSYALYRCGDDTYVAVHACMSPPLGATRLYGHPTMVRASPRNADSAGWRHALRRIEASMYAVVPLADVDEMFVLR